MDEGSANPEGLVLPDGIDPVKLVEAVSASGYPLQTVVARQLDHGFNVVEEWGFVDRVSQEHRALDVYAYRRLESSSSRLEPSLALLVECKRSDLPYVFFAAGIPRTPSDFPPIVGFPRSRFHLHQGSSGSVEISPAAFLRCSDFSFVQDPPVAVTFSRVERKSQDLRLSGDVPYRTVVLPLASALDHLRDSRGHAPPQQPVFFPTLAVCACVVDAPLVLASGTPETPELSMASWVRLVHQETLRDGSWWRRRDYFVDVVRRDFLCSYVDEHLLPFAERIASRMTEREELMLAGAGKVASWDSWTWDEIQSVST